MYVNEYVSCRTGGSPGDQQYANGVDQSGSAVTALQACCTCGGGDPQNQISEDECWAGLDKCQEIQACTNDKA